MSNLTADKKTQFRKEELPPGAIAVGQNTRATTLELISRQTSTKEEGEEYKDEDLTAEFSFSSEYPVLRYDWWEDERFYEVLSHKKEHVNTSRIDGGVCPLLWNHDRNIQRGIVRSVSFADGKANCQVLYDDDEEGRSLYKKMMAGTRRGISFMYQVYDEYKEMSMKESVEFLSKYGLTDKKFFPVRVSENWEVFEVSHVTIPADPTIGVGKSLAVTESAPIIITVRNYSNLNIENTMSKKPLQEIKELEQTNTQTTEDSSVKTEVAVAEQANEEHLAPPTTISLTPELLKEYLAQTIAPIQAEVQELRSAKDLAESERTAIAKEKERLAQELEQAKQFKDLFADISKLTGKPAVEMPAVNTQTNPSRNEPHGLAKEFLDLYESPKVKSNYGVVDPATGISATQRDHNVLASFMNQHFAEEKARGVTDWRNSQLIKDLDQYFKSHGLLSGRAAGPTIGTSGSIGSIYLDVLSTMMRETHNPNNIWWQFASTVYDPSSAPNKSVLIPRANYLPAPTDVNDFLLASTDTYNSINYVRGLSTDSQSLEITTVPVTIKQWGLGLSTGIGNRPVFIPEFHEATSLLNLMQILDTRLMQHYHRFEDLFILRQYLLATTIYYNDAGSVATVPANVAANDDGTLSRAFLNALYARLYADQWPTLPNNCYMLAVPPESLNNLKESLGTQYSPVTEAQNQAITNVLRAATGIEIGQSSGYVGQYCGFEIFSGNTWGVGAPGGSNPTVNTTTFGAGATVTEDCFVFSYGAVGRGIALPMEIRASGTTPFQMGESFIWISREESAPIDLDATISTGQQTRVAKVRVARRKV